MILTQYKKYEGTITLNGLDVTATNTLLRDKLVKAGFSNVEVIGSGRTRIATGVWSKPSQTADLPKQVTEIKEV